MKKIILAVMACTCFSFALNNPSLPVDVTTKDTLTRAQFDANWDTIYVWASRTNDSIGKKFLRCVALPDSVWSRIRVDSIRSNPNIDSVAGNPWFSGNVRADSLWGVKAVHSKKGNLDTIITDSIKTRALKVQSIRIDSLHGKTVIDTLRIDSISTRIINLTQFDAGIDSGIVVDTILFHTLKVWAKVGDDYNTIVNINAGNIKAYNIKCHSVTDTSFLRTSGAFKINLTGLSAPAVDSVRWIKQGYPSGDTMVYLFFGTKSGTSNSTGFASDTTFPVEVRPTVTARMVPIVARDAAQDYQSAAILLNTNGTIVFYKEDINFGDLTATWTNTGTKGYYNSVVVYKK